MTDRLAAAGRLVVVLVAAVVGIAVGWFLFVERPGDVADLLGVVLAIAVAVFAVKQGSSIAQSLLPSHNVAEVAVDGPITRDGVQGTLPAPGTPGADDIVEQIERADEDRGAEALLLELNTPGGQVVPSDDIRLAAEAFDGPTVAYATDVCASGGYWIASGCDELWAREGTLVGSIGVIGSRVTAADLMDKLGLQYERLAAGEYKDAGVPLKEMDEDEREYLQGLIDGYYDEFVDQVAEGRDMDEETIRDTEARTYLGRDALEAGLVDEVGTREDALDDLEDRLGEETVVREFEPQRGLTDRLGAGARRVAYATGAGVASVLGDDGREVDIRL